MMATLSIWPTIEDEDGLPVAQWMGRQYAAFTHDLFLDFSHLVVFSYYYRRFFPYWVRQARWAFSWEEMEAQDMVQECCLKFWQHAQERGPLRMHPMQFRQFVRRMLLYRRQDVAWQHKQYPERSVCSLERMMDDLDWDVAAADSSVAVSPAVTELAQQCEQAVQDQPERMQQAMQLAMRGYTPVQVAAEMGVSDMVAYTLLWQSRKRLARTVYQRGQRHRLVMAAMRHYWRVATCQQCGVLAVLASDGRCAACLAQAEQTMQYGCRGCGAVVECYVHDLCPRCYNRVKSRGGRMACTVCGQVARLNSHGRCAVCVERLRQEPCSDCGQQTSGRKKRGRCNRCDLAWRHRMRKAAQMAL